MTMIRGIATWMLAIACPLLAAQSRAQATAAQPPDCSALDGSSSQGQRPLATYANEPVPQLKKAIPSLRGLEIAGEKSASGDGDGAQLAAVLGQTSRVVAGMLRDMPNLIAREQVDVDEPGEDAPAVMGAAPSRRSTYSAIGPTSSERLEQAISETVFNYRIVKRDDPVFGATLDESRTDLHGRALSDAVSAQPRSVNFAMMWFIFLPGELPKSHFRFLGEQKVGKQETYVVTFAQVPGESSVRTLVSAGAGRCATFVQGVAWIDRSSFQIVRMETDLLHPLPAQGIEQLRSTVDYGAVKIPEHQAPFWLPRDVDVEWNAGQGRGGERHHYSHYHLFQATTKILYGAPPEK